MDAQYLKKNVHGALTEALTSMAVALPDDKIDYIGRYLLQYVERKKSIVVAQKELVEILGSEAIYTRETDAKEARKVEEQAQISSELERLPQFISSFKTAAVSKESAMSLVCNFVVDYLKIPAAYIAISVNTPEGECLQYTSANKTQDIVLGKILKPAADDGDEGVERQGLSFDAFKIPEVDMGDDDFDEDGNPKPKPTPKPRPLVVENTMREKRCKFFGIPKLGAYLAVPLSFDSIDHENGCLPGSSGGDQGEDTSPGFVANKINQKILLGLDTIGAYRTFKASDIEAAQKLGDVLVAAFKDFDDKLFEDQIKFLSQHKAHLEPVAAAVSSVGANEAAALATVNDELAAAAAALPPPSEGDDDSAAAAPGLPESLRPFKEADAVLATWSSLFAPTEPLAHAIVSLQDHVLPVPTVVNQLFYAVCAISGVALKVVLDPHSHEPSWPIIRKNALTSLPEKISAYKPAGKSKVSKSASLAAVKELTERYNLTDANAYPAHLPALGPLAQWLQKAILAREAAMVYYLEANKETLEVVIQHD